MEFSVEEMIKELEYEIRMRKRVYSRLVLEGKMTPAAKERGISILQAIIEILEKHSSQKRLF